MKLLAAGAAAGGQEAAGGIDIGTDRRLMLGLRYAVGSERVKWQGRAGQHPAAAPAPQHWRWRRPAALAVASHRRKREELADVMGRTTDGLE